MHQRPPFRFWHVFLTTVIGVGAINAARAIDWDALFRPAVPVATPTIVSTPTREGEKPCYRLSLDGSVIGTCDGSPRPRPRLDLHGNILPADH